MGAADGQQELVSGLTRIAPSVLQTHKLFSPAVLWQSQMTGINTMKAVTCLQATITPWFIRTALFGLSRVENLEGRAPHCRSRLCTSFTLCGCLPRVLLLHATPNSPGHRQKLQVKTKEIFTAQKGKRSKMNTSPKILSTTNTSLLPDLSFSTAA